MKMPKGFIYAERDRIDGFGIQSSVTAFIRTRWGEDKGFYYAWIKLNNKQRDDIEKEKGINYINAAIVKYIEEVKLFSYR